MSRPLRRRLRLRGMALRLGLLVLVTSLVTALAISWVSVGAVEKVLHARIDQNLPEYLEAAQIRLDLWYQQKLLGLERAARSSSLRRAVGSEPSAERAERALTALHTRHPGVRGIPDPERGGHALGRDRRRLGAAGVGGT